MYLLQSMEDGNRPPKGSPERNLPENPVQVRLPLFQSGTPPSIGHTNADKVCDNSSRVLPCRVHVVYCLVLLFMFLVLWLLGILLVTFFSRALLCILFIIWCFITVSLNIPFRGWGRGKVFLLTFFSSIFKICLYLNLLI